MDAPTQLSARLSGSRAEAVKFQEQIEYQRMIEGNGVKPVMIYERQ